MAPARSTDEKSRRPRRPRRHDTATNDHDRPGPRCAQLSTGRTRIDRANTPSTTSSSVVNRRVA